ncbi:uncharacterized protein LOC126823803 [Patella vulgata]|uniref:uncharacterized protein LOC126823803 n=1 Tax=Patella vulgata TaxID=6465 RepID=UPI00217FC995|nr:uncharacterized protein LOC126823803 [Patella vulgata]
MADVPLNRVERRQLIERIRQHEADFVLFVNQRQNTIRLLLEVADELDTSKWRVRISRLAGSSGGILSGVLTVVGLVTLPVGGVGAGFLAAGGVVGGLAAATGAGANIGDAVVSGKRKKQCNQVLEADNQAVLHYQNCLDDIRLFIRGVLPIGTVVVQLVRLVDVLLDASGATVRAVGAAVDAVPIVGAVFNLITLPLDIGTLISNSIDIHRATPHQISVRIREIAQQLDAQLRDLQLRHDDEREELENVLLERLAPRPRRISRREMLFYVCVIVVFSIINLVIFMCRRSDGPLLLTYDLPMLPFD